MKKIISIILALSMMLTLCACGKSDEAKHADETIAAIGTVTTSSLSQIERAEKEVENLSDKDVKSLDNLTMLYDAREEYNKLMADTIEVLIDAIGELNFDSKYIIENARTQYNELDEESKALVENYAVLEKAEKEISKVRADIVMDEIEALSAMPVETDEDGDAVYDAIEAIDSKMSQLSEEEKSMVTNLELRKEKVNEYNILLTKQTIGDLSIKFDIVYSHLELDIFFNNTSDKTIKYISWEVMFKNTVGDYLPVYGQESIFCDETGPYEPGEGNHYNGLVFKFYKSEVSIYEVQTVEIASVEIEYMDGTKVTLDNAEALQAVMK